MADITQTEVYIGDLRVGHGTNVKVSPDQSSTVEETKTFDEVITDGSNILSWKITMDRLRYDTAKEYQDFERLLYTMFDTPQNMKVVNRTRGRDGNIVKVSQVVYNCLVDGKDYESKPGERITENLSFKGGKMKEWINGVLVTPW